MYIKRVISSEFCIILKTLDYKVDFRCVSACSLAVCGDNALCSAALHRPVCACQDGYEGNPYDKCTKVGQTLMTSVLRK